MTNEFGIHSELGHKFLVKKFPVIRPYISTRIIFIGIQTHFGECRSHEMSVHPYDISIFGL